ncbi:hypothetical protein, partial [Arachidicoccus sp.]|uniref:hypothetical protein n=1 Tax=Arachidicoccus sp. TaxID=1872624 RepID=UPI003D1D44D0
IMREHHQYFLGVGSGDAAKLLRDKIRQYDMNTGDGSVNNSGYLRYSFHDVYSEAFVSLGLLGLATIVALYAYIGFLGIENKISLLKNIFITVSLSSFTDVIVINNQNDNSLILTIVCLCILLIRSENKTKDIQYIIAAN